MFSLSKDEFFCTSFRLNSTSSLEKWGSISDKEAVAVPDFPTTIPAATLASFTADEISNPVDRAAAILAITVSPAPDTSKTSLAWVGKLDLIILLFSF